MLVSKYKGEQTIEYFNRLKGQLIELAIEKKLNVSGDAVWAGYDGPSTPSKQRRYEVMLPVAITQ